MIFNLTKNRPVSERPFYAVRMWDRARGMIARGFEDFDAMVFPRCGAIHTFFMGMPIDVIFVDGENTVVRICEGVRPWLPCISARRAESVIEMPQGAVRRTGTETGDRLDLSAEMTAEKEEEQKRNLFRPCCNSFEQSESSRRI